VEDGVVMLSRLEFFIAVPGPETIDATTQVFGLHGLPIDMLVRKLPLTKAAVRCDQDDVELFSVILGI
jgi:hypothetical protein